MSFIIFNQNTTSMIELYGCKLLDDLRFMEVKSLIMARLPKSSRDLAERFRHTTGQQRKLTGELLVRAISSKKLGISPEKISWEYSEKNKPFFSTHRDFHFNISHSGEWVVAAFSEKPVGIDVEKIRRINFKLADRFFSPEESRSIRDLPQRQRTELFFEIWTLKESYLKALGTGLSRSLSSFTVLRENNGYGLYENEKRKNWHLHQFNLDKDHKMAICGSNGENCKSFKRLYIDDLINML